MNIDRDKLKEFATKSGIPNMFESAPIGFSQFASLVSAHAITSMQGDSEPITLIALKNAESQKRIAVLEDLLSSAYNIANRNGESTHWQRFAGQLHINGISPVTPKTFKILPSDDEYSQLSTNTDGWVRVLEAAKTIVENKQDSYKAKNGKTVFMQGDDGERMYLVGFDDMFNLENAINQDKGESV